MNEGVAFDGFGRPFGIYPVVDTNPAVNWRAIVKSPSGRWAGASEKGPSERQLPPTAATRNFFLGLWFFFWILSFQLGALAAVPAPPALTPGASAFFENKIRPLLTKNCYKCHSSESLKVKGELLLDTREGVLKGGATGPAIVPGDPEKSLLIKAVRYSDPDLQMPPKGDKLSDAQINDLVAWVKMGAPDPRVGKSAIRNAKSEITNHWSFHPVTRPPVPPTQEPSRCLNPIDSFIVAKLEEKGMKLSPPADKRTLIRRAYYDLIGLPPTPEEVQAFLDDSSPDAFATVVDRLLASPRYGERWGRHWLDVARYSDTKGEIKRQRDTPVYPFAWTYRDYVIQAFNDDKPFDRFILEQIAADKLPLGKDNSALAALGFLTLGERFQNNENDIINDRIDVVTKGFLGLTVTCARCHDHMFDPIPTQDYYSLHGIFKSSPEPKVQPVMGDPTKDPEYADYYAKRMALEKEMETLQAQIRGKRREPQKNRELQRQRIELLNRIDALDLSHPGSPPRANTLADSADPQDSRVFIRGEAENKGAVAPRRFLACLSGPSRKPFTLGSGRIELANAIASKSNPLTARVAVNRIWQHHFGEGIVSTVDDFGTMGAAPSHPELLDWLASEFMSPVESFNRSSVKSGNSSASNDSMIPRFNDSTIPRAWSFKHMHRLILLSQTWQQSSADNPRSAQLDPFNKLFWRANLRRLELEPLRDSLLAFGGKLDTNMFGKPVPLAQGKGRGQRAAVLLEPTHRPQDIGYTTRRTVYGYVDRADLPEVFNHFDFASPEMPNGHRYETTVPQQALYLMNRPLVVEQARNLVERPDVVACATDEAKVRRLYEILYQRTPRPEEIQLGIEFVEDAATPEDTAPASAAAAPLNFRKGNVGNQVKAKREAALVARKAGVRQMKPLTAWAEYAHALLLANEACFVN
jgi:mono/diheme cytochrome c family protein